MPTFGDADASTPAFASVNSNWNTTGATSGSFTPPAGSLVVLAVMTDTSSGANPGNETVTDSADGATGWTFKRRRAKPDSGSQAGNCALWVKTYAAAPGSPITVTVVGNATGASAGGFKTHVVAGCSGIEGDDEGSNTAAAVSLSITSSTDNARGMVMATDWNVAANMTAGTSQTALLASGVGSGPDTRVYLGIRDAVTHPAGAVTMSTASPTTGNANNFIGWFLTPSAGGTNATATPSTVAAVGAVPAPTLSTGSTVTLATVAAPVAVPSPTVALGVAILPGSVAAPAAVPSPTVSTGSVVTLAAAVAALAAVPSSTLSTGSVVTLGTVAASAAVPSPSVVAGGSATAAPDSVAAVAAIPTPTLSTGQRATLGGAVAAVAAVPTPAILVETIVQLQSVDAIATVPTHSAISTGSTVVLGGPVAIVGNVHTPSVSLAAGLRGEAHGPLPLVVGAVTVHTVSIAGSIN